MAKDSSLTEEVVEPGLFSPAQHHQVNQAEFDRCRAEARANLHNADCEQLLEHLRNVCIDNPSIAEFDGLMLQIKEAGCCNDDVADAFRDARDTYEQLHPGEQFPLAAPQWVRLAAKAAV